MSPRLRAYVTATVLAAVGVLAWGWPQGFPVDWGHYVAWIVICLVSETMWSNTLSGSATWSLSATAGLSSAVLYGTGAGMWLSALSTLIGDLFVQRKPWVRAAFNTSQVALATGIGGLLFEWLGGRAVTLESQGAVRAALTRHREGRGDFADYLIHELATAQGVSQLHTYDKALLKEAGFIKP